MIKFSRGTSHIVSPHQSLPATARAKRVLCEKLRERKTSGADEERGDDLNIKHKLNGKET